MALRASPDALCPRRIGRNALVAMMTSSREAKSVRARPRILARPGRVHVRGVEEIDPQIEGMLDERPVLLRLRPLVRTSSGIAKLMHPRQIADTSRPVLPSFRY